MPKSLDVTKYKKVIQFQPKIKLFFSYVHNLKCNERFNPEITHAHSVFNNSFVFCTRLNNPLNWRVDFVSENSLDSYDIAIILKTILCALRLQFDLNSEVILGNQAKLAYGIGYEVCIEQHKLIFTLNKNKLQENSLQLVFNFTQNIYIDRFIDYLSYLRNTVSSFFSVCQERSFKYIFQALEFFLPRRILQFSEDNVFLYLNSKSECNAIVKFIRIINSNNDARINLIKFFKDQIVEIETDQILEFFMIIRTFKRTMSVNPVIRFPGSLFILKYAEYGDSSDFSLYFGPLNICSIKEHELRVTCKNTFRFYFALKFLYAEVDKVKVIDMLLEHKLLIV